MPVKLHRCLATFAKFEGHPCWTVQKALDDAGIEYEVVKHMVMGLRRDEIERLSGQKQLPVIEFEDGSVLREDSKDLAARIRDGRLGTSAR